MTTWWPVAPTATTRSSDGRPSGAPASVRAWPVRAAATAWAGDSIGTSRSAPGDTLMIRPWASSTWMVSVPGGDGDRAGQPVLVDERGHRDRALPGRVVEFPGDGDPQGIDQEHGRAREGERQPGRGDERQPGPQASPPPPSGGPAPLAGHGQPPSAASRYPAPRTVCRAFLPERRVDLAPQVPRVDLDHVHVRDRIRIPDVVQ